MKITKYFLSMAAAIGMIAGCQKPEMVQISSPEDVVAPVLETFEGPIEITPSNLGLEDIVLTWSLADYGVPTQIDYSVEAAVAANPDTKVIITSGIVADDKEQEAGCISEKITYETLNAVLFNDLKLEDGVAAEVNFTIGSKVGEYAKVYSNAVTVTCKVTASEKQYPKVWVIGDYCGWAHDKSQFLFDFAGDDAVYQGVVDFGEKAANGWKITGVGKWDDTCNWGGEENATYEEEAETTQLINGGGSKDLKHYSKRFYHFSFEKETLVLTKTLGFDKIGVVGAFNGWDAAASIEMSFNAAKQKFYADVEFAEDGEFKFCVDGKWDISFGTGEEGFLTSDNGGNIAVKAGNYRIYLMMNNYGEITYELNPKMFGKDEPVGGTTPAPEDPEDPETPEPVKGWSLIGAFNSWGGDLMLTSDGTFHFIKGVELEGELKFRKDGQWNYKGEDGNDVQTNLGAAEGVTFAADEELALAPNGGNINVTAGTYDVYLDPENAKAWFITDGSYPGGATAPVASEWGLIGDMAPCNSWTKNITLFEDGDYYSAKGVSFTAGNQFKFRKGVDWGVELTYEGQISIDAKLDLVDGTGGKQNSKIAETGTFDVYLAKDLTCYYVMTQGKTPDQAGEAEKIYVDPSDETFVVGFSGSEFGWDDPSFDTNDRASFVSKNVTDPATFAGTYEFKIENLAFAEGDEFKVRINGQWIGCGGAEIVGLTTSGSDNFVAGETGTYSAVITFDWNDNSHSNVKVVFSK